MVGSQSAGSSSGSSSRTLPRLGVEDAGLDHAGDAGVLSLGERLGHAVLALGEARLLEPSQRPAAIGVEVALLLGQRLVEGLVDERQRLAHGERLAFGVEHFGVASIDGHARADGGLRQVHRGDVAALEVRERRGQFGLECGDKSRRVAVGASAARGRQTRTMLEARALVPDPIMPVAQLRAHRPSAADGEASPDHCVEKGLPAGADRARRHRRSRTA